MKLERGNITTPKVEDYPSIFLQAEGGGRDPKTIQHMINHEILRSIYDNL